MLLSAALLILLTVLLIICLRKLWKLFHRMDWNRFNPTRDPESNAPEENRGAMKRGEEIEGAVGGHNHEEHEFRHDCAACRQSEGTFVTMDLSKNSDDEKVKKDEKKTPSTSQARKWYDIFRFAPGKAKSNGDEKEHLQLDEVSSSSSLSLFNVENVGRRRHSGDEEL